MLSVLPATTPAVLVLSMAATAARLASSTASSTPSPAPVPSLPMAAATAAMATLPSPPHSPSRGLLPRNTASTGAPTSSSPSPSPASSASVLLHPEAVAQVASPPLTPSASQATLRTMSAADLAELNREFARRSPVDILRWLQRSPLGKVVQFTSFGLSGMVITDLMSKLDYDVPVAFIDTLHHFDETLALRNEVLRRYGRKVLSFGPQAAEDRAEFTKLYGDELWKTDPDFYQYLTKIEPTGRALEQLAVDVWITGRRRSQGDARATLQVLEVSDDGRIKVNPLAWVSWTEVSGYVAANDVPYNALLDQGYRSIGDVHSTLPTSNNDSERAGRWSGTFRTECGMHSLNARAHRNTAKRLNSDTTDEEITVVASPAAAGQQPRAATLTLGRESEDDTSSDSDSGPSRR